VNPDFTDLPPAYKVRWDAMVAEDDKRKREGVISDIKFLREFRRAHTRNAVLADREPSEELLTMIDDLLVKLTDRLL
jgi:hypothetical protein